MVILICVSFLFRRWRRIPYRSGINKRTAEVFVGSDGLEGSLNARVGDASGAAHGGYKIPKMSNTSMTTATASMVPPAANMRLRSAAICVYLAVYFFMASPWTEHVSTKSQRMYYFNARTNETRWTKPTAEENVSAHYDRSAALAAAGGAASAADAGARAAINFCKTTLMSAHIKHGMSVLDVCCGRGGDLGKCARLGVAEYHGLDVSPESVREAQARAAKLPQIRARLHVGDAAAPKSTLPPELRVDVCICNLALHYFFDTPARLNAVMSLVSTALKPGGVFIGVLCDAHTISQRAVAAALVSRSFGNALYSVDMSPRFIGALECGLGLGSGSGLGSGLGSDDSYGLAYDFSMSASGLVDRCTEYLAPERVLRAAAAAHGLVAPDGGCRNLLHYFHAHPDVPTRAAMRVPAVLSLAEAELLGLYCTFVFKKI